jgi:hypothetical protein
VKRIFTAIAFAFSLCSLCYGEWYWGTSESLSSENAKFSARITERTGGTHELEVYGVSPQKLLWSKNIDWQEDFAGFLSDDGAFFSIVNDDYSNQQFIVFVYSRYGQAGYSIKEIRIDREYLVDRGGKLGWIDLEGGNIRYVYDAKGAAQYLDLVILSGKTLEIKL